LRPLKLGAPRPVGGKPPTDGRVKGEKGLRNWVDKARKRENFNPQSAAKKRVLFGKGKRAAREVTLRRAKEEPGGYVKIDGEGRRTMDLDKQMHEYQGQGKTEPTSETSHKDVKMHKKKLRPSKLALNFQPSVTEPGREGLEQG